MRYIEIYRDISIYIDLELIRAKHKKSKKCTFLQLFRIGQILIRKRATESSVETNENSIVTSQWRSNVIQCDVIHCMSTITCFVIVLHHVGEAGKQNNASYNYHYRRYGGVQSPPTHCMIRYNMVQSLVNLLILLMRL